MKKRGSLVMLAAIACLPLAACGGCDKGGSGSGSSGTASSSTAALSAAESASAPVASTSSSANRRNAMMVRAGGAVGALFRAASQADLDEATRTKIEGIANDMREADKTAAEADGGGPRKEMKEIHEAMTAGVKAGRIDGSKLEPHYAALEKEAKERAARDYEGLGKLHDALDADTRKKLGEQVRKQEDERNERAKKAEAAQAAHAGDGGRPSASRRRFERYGKDLDLDADQKKKLDGIIPADDPKMMTTIREEGVKRTNATIDAFEKDTFDAKGIPTPDIKQVRRPMDEQVKFFNALIPILKPEQKEKLVTRLEKQEGGGGPGGPGGEGFGGRRRPPGMPPGSGGDREHEGEDKKDDDHDHP